MVSVGALADPELEAELLEAARDGNARIRIASGAVGALDAIRAASLGGIDSVTHTTRKPARALLPPQQAAELSGPREIFAGSARAAALRFPESVNVVAAVSLAGIGFDRTTARVIADPDICTNQHEIRAQGQFGSLCFQINNVPSDANPKTGRIVAMSIVAQLLQRTSSFIIG
jgi:aspartate dehydrogenase